MGEELTAIYNAMDFSRFGTPSEEWKAFAEANHAAAADGFSNNEVSEASKLRETSNKTRRAVSAQLITDLGLDKVTAASTVHIPTRGSHSIALRVYKPLKGETEGPNRALLYYHGGGFLFGDETTDDLLCCNIAHNTGVTVLSVIYRHTDEYKHPAQTDDAWDAFEYVRQNAASLEISLSPGIGVMGISAGATLAAGVCLRHLEDSRSRSEVRMCISGVIMSIPWLIHIDNYPFHLFASPDVSAKVQCAERPVIPSKRMQLFSNLLGAENPMDRLLNIPLVPEADLRGWPKTAFLVAGADPLRDDGLLFAKKLEKLR